MKKIRIALNTAATVGLVAAVSLAESIDPTTKELISSVVMVAMSGVMLMVANDIKNISSSKN